MIGENQELQDLQIGIWFKVKNLIKLNEKCSEVYHKPQNLQTQNRERKFSHSTPKSILTSNLSNKNFQVEFEIIIFFINS